MTRIIALFSLLFFASFVMPALAADDYICPMHPQIHGKKGDKCSICHMPLELVGADHTHNETPQPAQKENMTPAPSAIKAGTAISK